MTFLFSLSDFKGSDVGQFLLHPHISFQNGGSEVYPVLGDTSSPPHQTSNPHINDSTPKCLLQTPQRFRTTVTDRPQRTPRTSARIYTSRDIRRSSCKHRQNQCLPQRNVAEARRCGVPGNNSR